MLRVVRVHEVMERGPEVPTLVVQALEPDVWVREDTPIMHHGSWGLSEDPSTMATGEEGGPPTTMATGEECGGFVNPFDLVGNPFSQF